MTKAERVFKCESVEVQRVFCAIIADVLKILTSQYNATVAPFILVSTENKVIMEIRTEAMRWRPFTQVDQDYVDSMMMLSDPEVLKAFLFD